MIDASKQPVAPLVWHNASSVYVKAATREEAMRHLKISGVVFAVLLIAVGCSREEGNAEEEAATTESAANENSGEDRHNSDESPNAERASDGPPVAFESEGRDQREVATEGVREPAPRTVCFIGAGDAGDSGTDALVADFREQSGEGVVSLVLTSPEQFVRSVADEFAAAIDLSAIAQPQLRELDGDVSFADRRAALQEQHDLADTEAEQNERAFARAVSVRGLLDSMIAAGTVAVVVAPPEFGTLVLASFRGAGIQAAFDREPLAPNSVECVQLAVEPRDPPPSAVVEQESAEAGDGERNAEQDTETDAERTGEEEVAPEPGGE